MNNLLDLGHYFCKVVAEIAAYFALQQLVSLRAVTRPLDIKHKKAVLKAIKTSVNKIIGASLGECHINGELS